MVETETGVGVRVAGLASTLKVSVGIIGWRVQQVIVLTTFVTYS